MQFSDTAIPTMGSESASRRVGDSMFERVQIRQPVRLGETMVVVNRRWR